MRHPLHPVLGLGPQSGESQWPRTLSDPARSILLRAEAASRPREPLPELAAEPLVSWVQLGCFWNQGCPLDLKSCPSHWMTQLPQVECSLRQQSQNSRYHPPVKDLTPPCRQRVVTHPAGSQVLLSGMRGFAMILLERMIWLFLRTILQQRNKKVILPHQKKIHLSPSS